MTKILFICHGNICRSPMAEFIMKDMVKKAGLEKEFLIESAATSREELGNPVYPPARRKLAEHGICCSGKTARQLQNHDYEQFDLLIGMDSRNLRNMQRILSAPSAVLRTVALRDGACGRSCGGDFSDKMRLLLDDTDRPGDVADPWYTGDFEATWRDVEAGCRGLLNDLIKGGAARYGTK
ncbi:low molecular weight phosphotyrosine protein phosphatase [Anaerotruncus sp. AF02-27]|jgi:protein-tyrosine phosphatase|uniref:low molecular weight protein-tyrosine-phosphatase n=1 Tax=Anaerotruncus sp. AF02-27 TaxID=2292191 RepID=UPI000E4A77E9|nr:low molecular weight protein-tyrosine-phosphatase [Anaerotruncus sp. AF02-27]RGX56763.1 low molecular weight phosphotyrosine protein phosphatase [Anaerotruncus sp. AF02-27]